MEQFDEAVYAQVLESERYQRVMEMLGGMAEDGDPNAIETMAIINSLIPNENKPQTPPIPKPQTVPPIRKPEAEKKHVTKDGKK